MPNVRFVVVSAGLLFTAIACRAQTPATAPPTVPHPIAVDQASNDSSTTAHPLEKADLDAFFDGIVPVQLERGDIAGASVLVMQDGKTLLEKGYGYADLKTKRRVDPETTIFRLASISKLFTWVSVMQLEEAGKLDLDVDINRYLDFQIEPEFNKPITLRNLMTHTGGFEEVDNDIILTDPNKALSLRDFLMQNQPKRLFPPGAVPAYSNYGVGLASYIVQRVSGEPFEQYAQDHIFSPLRMTHSSFYQPLGSALKPLASEGYRTSTLKPVVGFEIFSPVGAGGLSSTAEDMGRFGQALLNGGALDGNRILRPETLAEMWTPQFQASDQLPPACMGFYEDWRNGMHWIGHSGDLIAFHSMFFMEPRQKLLLFVSYNSVGGGNKPRAELVDLFTDRYFPAAVKQDFLKVPISELKAVEGAYEPTRRADSTKLKFSMLFNQDHASVDDDGVLDLDGFKDLRGHPIHWKPTGKDLWQEVDGQRRLFFIRDGQNRVVRIAFDFPGEQYERVPWYEDIVFVFGVGGGCLGILGLVFIASLLRVGQRIGLRKRPRPAPLAGTIWLSWGPRLAACTWVGLFGSIAIFVLVKANDPFPPTPNWFVWFEVMNWATGLSILLSAFAAWSAIRIWWRKNVRVITKVKFSVVGLACLILCWFAVHWHVIGPAHRI